MISNKAIHRLIIIRNFKRFSTHKSLSLRHKTNRMNSSLLRRLKYYGMGFGIGCVFVFFFFQNRGCSWLPGNRVKNSILDRVIVASDMELEFMKSKGLTKEDILSALNDGDINFGASKKEGNTQVYLIEKEFDKLGNTKFYFTLPKESYISEVKMGAKNAQEVYNSSTGYGHFIHFPKDDYLIFVDTAKRVTCQQELIDMISPKKLFSKVKSNGFVDFAASKFDKRPKAEQMLRFVIKNDTIGMNTFWYQNKINVSTFVIPFSNQCDSISQLK